MSAGSLRLLSRLAARNVVRYRRRTAVVVLAVGVGLWAMLVYVAFSRGWENGVVDSAVRTLTGHVQIHAPGYVSDPSVDYLMPAPGGRLLDELRAPNVRAWASRIRVPAVVQSERETAGVTLVGIDDAAERGLSFIDGAVTAGRDLGSPDADGVLLGRDLADRLSTGLGKRVVLISEAADHEVAERGFRVVGIFDADRSATEMTYVFTGRATAARLLGVGSRVSEVAIELRDPAGADAEVSRLRATAPALDVQPWTALEPIAEATVSLAEMWIWIFYALMYVAMASGLVNTLLMAVLERTREFGLLQALGMAPGLLLRQVLIESIFVLLLGVGVGVTLGFATVGLLHGGIDFSAYAAGAEMWGMGKAIYPALGPRDVASAVAVVMVLGALASLYPAIRAARRVPLEAITRG
jgi:ABC-type lipoprotein release transport system permease subunit